MTYEEKIEQAIKDLQIHEPPEGFFVCFSGGKDTVVMYDLIKRAGVKYNAVHNYVAIEPPPLIDFIKEYYPEVYIDYPNDNMKELIIKFGFPPMRHIRYCHRHLKTGGEGRIKVLGIRAEEGRKRASRSKFAPNKFGGYDLNLIIDWTAHEIWRYIFQNNIPYCKLYDEGRKRIGCLFCPYESYNQVKLDITEFPEVAKYLIDACQSAIDTRVKAGKQLGKYKTGADMFFNWISGGRDNKEEKVVELKNIYYPLLFTLDKLHSI